MKPPRKSSITARPKRPSHEGGSDGGKRLPITLSERYGEPVRRLAYELLTSPNAVVTSMVDGCLEQINDVADPIGPISIVKVIRRRLGRDRTPMERLIGQLLEKHLIKDFTEKHANWRALYFDEVNKTLGELTEERLRECERETNRRYEAGDYSRVYDESGDTPALKKWE